MSDEQVEKRLLHHYQHTDAGDVTHTYDLFRKTTDGVVTYEIKVMSTRTRLGCGIPRHETDSWTDPFEDEGAANAEFLKLIGVHVK